MQLELFALGTACGAALGAALARHVLRRAPRRSPLEDRLRAIFDASPAFIWLKDVENRMLLVNRRAAAALGRDPSEMEGQPTAAFYPGLASRYYADDLEVAQSGQAKLGFIEPLQDGKGGTTWVRTDKVPLAGADGRIVAIMVFALDVTELKRAELRLAEALGAAERASRAKTDLLSVVSHEIRTPLGIILGFSELLMTTASLPATSHGFAEKIHRNGKRLQKLIDDILDVARIEQGKVSVELATFSPRQLALELEPQFRERAQERGLELSLCVQQGTPAELVSDPNRLRQIVTNLVENAIKFTDAGLVDVSFGPRAESSGLEISVRDTGRGVPEAARARLFQPFSQLEPMVSKAGGVGLGLSLAKKLAQALGGDVELVESVEGKGSTFVAWVGGAAHRNAAAVNPPVAAATTKGPPAESLVGKVILLVEDHQDIRDMVVRFLASTGAKIEQAANGANGIEKAMTCAPDLVLMDLSMPSVDGMTATAILRERGFDKPIVAITANAMKGQAEACLAAGFDDFVTKPLTREELIARLARVLVPAQPGRVTTGDIER